MKSALSTGTIQGVHPRGHAQEWHDAWRPGMPRDVVFTIPEGAVEGAPLIVEVGVPMGDPWELGARGDYSNGSQFISIYINL